MFLRVDSFCRMHLLFHKNAHVTSVDNLRNKFGNKRSKVPSHCKIRLRPRNVQKLQHRVCSHKSSRESEIANQQNRLLSKQTFKYLSTFIIYRIQKIYVPSKYHRKILSLNYHWDQGSGSQQANKSQDSLSLSTPISQVWVRVRVLMASPQVALQALQIPHIRHCPKSLSQASIMFGSPTQSYPALRSCPEKNYQFLVIYKFIKL